MNYIILPPSNKDIELHHGNPVPSDHESPFFRPKTPKTDVKRSKQEVAIEEHQAIRMDPTLAVEEFLKTHVIKPNLMKFRFEITSSYAYDFFNPEIPFYESLFVKKMGLDMLSNKSRFLSIDNIIKNSSSFSSSMHHRIHNVYDTTGIHQQMPIASAYTSSVILPPEYEFYGDFTNLNWETVAQVEGLKQNLMIFPSFQPSVAEKQHSAQLKQHIQNAKRFLVDFSAVRSKLKGSANMMMDFEPDSIDAKDTDQKENIIDTNLKYFSIVGCEPFDSLTFSQEYAEPSDEFRNELLSYLPMITKPFVETPKPTKKPRKRKFSDYFPGWSQTTLFASEVNPFQPEAKPGIAEFLTIAKKNGNKYASFYDESTIKKSDIQELESHAFFGNHHAVKKILNEIRQRRGQSRFVNEDSFANENAFESFCTLFEEACEKFDPVEQELKELLIEKESIHPQEFVDHYKEPEQDEDVEVKSKDKYQLSKPEGERYSVDELPKTYQRKLYRLKGTTDMTKKYLKELTINKTYVTEDQPLESDEKDSVLLKKRYQLLSKFNEIDSFMISSTRGKFPTSFLLNSQKYASITRSNIEDFRRKVYYAIRILVYKLGSKNQSPEVQELTKKIAEIKDIEPYVSNPIIYTMNNTISQSVFSSLVSSKFSEDLLSTINVVNRFLTSTKFFQRLWSSDEVSIRKKRHLVLEVLSLMDTCVLSLSEMWIRNSRRFHQFFDYLRFEYENSYIFNLNPDVDASHISDYLSKFVSINKLITYMQALDKLDFRKTAALYSDLGEEGLMVAKLRQIAQFSENFTHVKCELEKIFFQKERMDELYDAQVTKLKPRKPNSPEYKESIAKCKQVLELIQRLPTLTRSLTTKFETRFRQGIRRFSANYRHQFVCSISQTHFIPMLHDNKAPEEKNEEFATIQKLFALNSGQGAKQKTLYPYLLQAKSGKDFYEGTSFAKTALNAIAKRAIFNKWRYKHFRFSFRDDSMLMRLILKYCTCKTFMNLGKYPAKFASKGSKTLKSIVCLPKWITIHQLYTMHRPYRSLFHLFVRGYFILYNESDPSKSNVLADSRVDKKLRKILKSEVADRLRDYYQEYLSMFKMKNPEMYEVFQSVLESFLLQRMELGMNSPFISEFMNEGDALYSKCQKNSVFQSIKSKLINKFQNRSPSSFLPSKRRYTSLKRGSRVPILFRELNYQNREYWQEGFKSLKSKNHSAEIESRTRSYDIASQLLETIRTRVAKKPKKTNLLRLSGRESSEADIFVNFDYQFDFNGNSKSVGKPLDISRYTFLDFLKKRDEERKKEFEEKIKEEDTPNQRTEKRRKRKRKKKKTTISLSDIQKDFNLLDEYQVSEGDSSDSCVQEDSSWLFTKFKENKEEIHSVSKQVQIPSHQELTVLKSIEGNFLNILEFLSSPETPAFQTGIKNPSQSGIVKSQSVEALNYKNYNSDVLQVMENFSRLCGVSSEFLQSKAKDKSSLSNTPVKRYSSPNGERKKEFQVHVPKLRDIPQSAFANVNPIIKPASFTKKDAINFLTKRLNQSTDMLPKLQWRIQGDYVSTSSQVQGRDKTPLAILPLGKDMYEHRVMGEYVTYPNATKHQLHNTSVDLKFTTTNRKPVKQKKMMKKRQLPAQKPVPTQKEFHDNAVLLNELEEILKEFPSKRNIDLKSTLKLSDNPSASSSLKMFPNLNYDIRENQDLAFFMGLKPRMQQARTENVEFARKDRKKSEFSMLKRLDPLAFDGIGDETEIDALLHGGKVGFETFCKKICPDFPPESEFYYMAQKLFLLDQEEAYYRELNLSSAYPKLPPKLGLLFEKWVNILTVKVPRAMISIPFLDRFVSKLYDNELTWAFKMRILKRIWDSFVEKFRKYKLTTFTKVARARKLVKQKLGEDIETLQEEYQKNNDPKIQDYIGKLQVLLKIVSREQNRLLHAIENQGLFVEKFINQPRRDHDQRKLQELQKQHQIKHQQKIQKQKLLKQKQLQKARAARSQQSKHVLKKVTTGAVPQQRNVMQAAHHTHPSLSMQSTMSSFEKTPGSENRVNASLGSVEEDGESEWHP